MAADRAARSPPGWVRGGRGQREGGKREKRERGQKSATKVVEIRSTHFGCHCDRRSGWIDFGELNVVVITDAINMDNIIFRSTLYILLGKDLCTVYGENDVILYMCKMHMYKNVFSSYVYHLLQYVMVLFVVSSNV